MLMTYLGSPMLCEHCKSELLDKRTIKQNSALHKYFELLAEELNNAGFDMRETIKENVDIPWTTETVKEYLWRPIQKLYLKKQSTTKLKKKDIDKVYDVLNRYLGEKTGVFVEFPNENYIELTNGEGKGTI